MAYIIKPLVTEKMTQTTEKQNKFGFIVRPEANKIEIQKEVEARYNVTVTDVNTMALSKSQARSSAKNKTQTQIIILTRYSLNLTLAGWTLS